MADNTGNDTPQFATAQYSTRPEPACKSCGQRITGPLYRVKGAPTCADCAQRLQQQMPRDSHAAFVRGMLFGVGAALLGFLIYVVFALSTGLVIGYVSLAVGYLVGKAVTLGSRGIGGRRYQIAAALLTYVAVSLAAVPIALSSHTHHKGAQPHAQQTQPAPAASVAPATAPHPKMSLTKALGTLALLGLASPFLELADPMHGIIGLIILLVGIRIAWQLTGAKAPDIAGPTIESAPVASG